MLLATPFFNHEKGKGIYRRGDVKIMDILCLQISCFTQNDE